MYHFTIILDYDFLNIVDNHFCEIQFSEVECNSLLDLPLPCTTLLSELGYGV